MRPWKRLASASVIENRWLTVTADTCELPTGAVVEPYFVIHEPEWVHVLALNDKDELLVVRQYRYAANAVCTELPGGAADRSEEPVAAARRELLEETGYTAETSAYVGALYANPARQTKRIHLFAARGLSRVAGRALDESENIEFAFLSVAAVQAAIEAGTFSQALHVASFYRSIQFIRAARAA
jgi:8-oxo-dGTP pyrophosphatase MutT (NUDIX family)